MKKFEDQNHEDLEAFFLSAQRALPAPSDQLRDRVLQNAQALTARQGAEKSDSNGSDIGFLGGLSGFCTEFLLTVMCADPKVASTAFPVRPCSIKLTRNT